MQAYYTEVLGETTRCPNKKFLIRRINETLAEQAERHAAIAEEPVKAESSPMSDIGQEEPTAARKSAAEAAEAAEAEPVAEPELETAGDYEPAIEPELVAEPELAAEPEPVVEPEPVAEPQANAEPQPDAEPQLAAEPANSTSTPDASPAASAAGDKPLTKLTVEELQQRYLDVVGRATGSSHRRYLTWKIRQAEKGRVPVGPRKRRSPDEPAPEFKVLPLRIEAEQVERLDAARERLGLKNRMELFRNALNTYFAAQGENEIAALFAR